MFITKMMASITHQIKLVNDKMAIAASRRPQHLQFAMPRLVAASKTKEVEMIIEAYDAGQRHFGENYVKELHEKSNDIELQDHCEEIKWHLIGHLQRNKISKVLDVPNLHMIESLHNVKVAKALNDAWGRLKKKEPLRVMAQCNTSMEENKTGCPPEEMLHLVRFINEECSNLNLTGLMTIGAYEFDCSKGPNPDFQALVSIRETVCEALKIPLHTLELSMGMSSDFEHAIELGSTNVRVGSTIFGARSKPNSKEPTISKPHNEDGIPENSSSQFFKSNCSTTEAAQKINDISIS